MIWWPGLWSFYCVKTVRGCYQSMGGKSIQAPLSLCFLFSRGWLQRQSQWQSSKLSDRARVFLEWPIWNTGQYKHSLAHHRQYHWKAKLQHNSQDFIGCHVDFSRSGISIGLSVFVWLMVCVFRLWNQQPESPNSLHISVWSLPPPAGLGLWVPPLMQTQHISLSFSQARESTYNHV